MSTANDNGRALEYCIFKQLLDIFPHAYVDEDSLRQQARDIPKFISRSDSIKERFLNASSIIVDQWLSNKFILNDISICRLMDSEGKKGNVSDISIITEYETINLSIKHNHDALKHQRPSALPAHLKINRNDDISLVYKRLYKSITQEFSSKCKDLLPTATKFHEIKEIDSNFINDNLYNPICKLVTAYINSNDNANVLKTFIFGTVPYYKVIVDKNGVNIFDFTSISTANTVSATLTEPNYVNVDFDGIKISMRLHTASSRLKGVSVKFDTRLDDKLIPIFDEQFKENKL